LGARGPPEPRSSRKRFSSARWWEDIATELLKEVVGGGEEGQRGRSLQIGSSVEVDDGVKTGNSELVSSKVQRFT